MCTSRGADRFVRLRFHGLVAQRAQPAPVPTPAQVRRVTVIVEQQLQCRSLRFRNRIRPVGGVHLRDATEERQVVPLEKITVSGSYRQRLVSGEERLRFA